MFLAAVVFRLATCGARRAGILLLCQRMSVSGFRLTSALFQSKSLNRTSAESEAFVRVAAMTHGNAKASVLAVYEF